LPALLAGIIVGCVLVFLTPLFKYTPLPTLSAIVITAAIALIDISEVKFLWKIKEYADVALLLVTLLVTLIVGPEIGAIVSIILSLVQVRHHMSRDLRDFVTN
jgi:sulfate transporter 4